MKKTEVIAVSLFSVLLMAMLPSISAVEYTSAKDTLENQIYLDLNNMENIATIRNFFEDSEEYREVINFLDQFEETDYNLEQDGFFSDILSLIFQIMLKLILTPLKLALSIPIKLTIAVLKLIITLPIKLTIAVLKLMIVLPIKLTLSVLKLIVLLPLKLVLLPLRLLLLPLKFIFSPLWFFDYPFATMILLNLLF